MSYSRGRPYRRIDIQELFFHSQSLDTEIMNYQLKPFLLDNLTQDNIIPTINRIILELIICFKSDFLIEMEFNHAIDKVLTYYEGFDIMGIDLIFNLLSDIFQQYLPFSNGFVAEYV